MQVTRMIFCVFLLFNCFNSQANSLPQQQAEPLFHSAVAHSTVPGINVAVADKSGVVWAQGFGFADVENQVVMTPAHEMRIGSVAKVITATALMRLYERGKIDLDKAVTHYSKDWPSTHPTITLRQLSSHTSGIRHYKKGANEFLLNQTFNDVASGLALFKDEPLVFEPGSQYMYSTFAWTLVSAAMEGADGKRDFKQIIQQEVFNPLNMHNSHFDEQYTIIKHRQRPYSVYQGQLFNSPQTDHSYKWAGGGFIATPSDISRFAVAHLDGSYLKPTSANLMFTKAKLNNGEEVNFGIGWNIGFASYVGRSYYVNNAEAQNLMANMPNAVMHSGSSMGGTTMLILCLDHGRAVTVVKNVDGDRSGDVFLLALKTLSFYHLLEP